MPFNTVLLVTLIHLLRLTLIQAGTIPEWAVCGGSIFSGADTCSTGLTCVYVNQHWSSCQKIQQLVNPVDPDPPPPPIATEQPEWGQCGGVTYTGSRVCASGLTCVYVNAWYSQCQKTVIVPIPTASPVLTPTAAPVGKPSPAPVLPPTKNPTTPPVPTVVTSQPTSAPIVVTNSPTLKPVVPATAAPTPGEVSCHKYILTNNYVCI